MTAHKFHCSEGVGLDIPLVHVNRLATLGVLAASIAHEIRQPLTAIRLEAGAIQRWINRNESNVAEISEGLCRIKDQSERAEQVVRSLWSLMRPAPTARQRFQLSKAIEELLPLVEADIKQAEAVLRLDLDSALPDLHGDCVQIQQLVLNLLLNAVDALKRRRCESPTILVRTRNRGDSTITLEVEDNGAGIPPEQLSRIFEPFFSTKSDGMGLGLAICRSIVASHNGTIQAKSDDGLTSMAVCLPLGA